MTKPGAAARADGLLFIAHASYEAPYSDAERVRALPKHCKGKSTTKERLMAEQDSQLDPMSIPMAVA